MAHAVLSPSASGRWGACPASVRMCRDLPPQPSSIYAIEGTRFHTLCEIEASRNFLDSGSLAYQINHLDWALDTESDWRDDQLTYVKDWIELLRGYLDEEQGARLLLEQRVDTGIPGCWGTADAVIIYSDRIRVIDIKYGAGVQVSAIDNSQLRLYGVGALGLADDPLKIREITNTVWQPRRDNLSEETLTRAELVQWRDDLIPIARLALGEDAPFGPSEEACRWCPVAGDCSARMKHVLAKDFGDPEVLSGEEMAEAFGRTSELKRWIADIEDTALKRAYEKEGSVPGFKVVRSGGRRGIPDPEKAIECLLAADFPPEAVYTQKPATLAELDKLAGSAEKLQQILGDLLVKSEGRLSLTADSDPRQPADAVHSAKDDFAGITDKGEA